MRKNWNGAGLPSELSDLQLYILFHSEATCAQYCRPSFYGPYNLYNVPPPLPSRIFPTSTFHSAVKEYLTANLSTNNRTAILKAKRMIKDQLLGRLLEGNARSIEEMANHTMTGIPARE